jgi:hypothetical protein
MMMRPFCYAVRSARRGVPKLATTTTIKNTPRTTDCFATATASAGRSLSVKRSI